MISRAGRLVPTIVPHERFCDFPFVWARCRKDSPLPELVATSGAKFSGTGTSTVPESRNFGRGSSTSRIRGPRKGP
jgi:hypothetical protein